MSQWLLHTYPAPAGSKHKKRQLFHGCLFPRLVSQPHECRAPCYKGTAFFTARAFVVITYLPAARDPLNKKRTFPQRSLFCAVYFAHYPILDFWQTNAIYSNSHIPGWLIKKHR